MKRLFSLSIFVIIILTSCKEFHKKNILAENEAREELKKEADDRYFESLKNSPPPPKDPTVVLAEEQKSLMDKDINFVFASNTQVGFKYKALKKLKYKMSMQQSEVNAKYKLYITAKELGAEGIINYKIHFEPFFVEGIPVKKI